MALSGIGTLPPVSVAVLVAAKPPLLEDDCLPLPHIAEVRGGGIKGKVVWAPSLPLRPPMSPFITDGGANCISPLLLDTMLDTEYVTLLGSGRGAALTTVLPGAFSLPSIRGRLAVSAPPSCCASSMKKGSVR